MKSIMTERQFLSAWGKYLQSQGIWYYRIPDANKWDAGKIKCPVCKNQINPDNRIRFTPSRPGDCLIARNNNLILIEAKRITGKSINFSKAFKEHQREALYRTGGHVLLFIDTSIGKDDFSAFCVDAGLLYQDKICFAVEFQWSKEFCTGTKKVWEIFRQRDIDYIIYRFKNKSRGFVSEKSVSSWRSNISMKLNDVCYDDLLRLNEAKLNQI